MDETRPKQALALSVRLGPDDERRLLEIQKQMPGRTKLSDVIRQALCTLAKTYGIE